MKAVIQTQFLENYGAHDWDGRGECPQRWKPKGGDTWVVDCNLYQSQSKGWLEAVKSCIEHSTDFAREYIISVTMMSDMDWVADQSLYVEEWEAPIKAELLEGLEDPKLLATRETLAWSTNKPVARRKWCQAPNAEVTGHSYFEYGNEEVA